MKVFRWEENQLHIDREKYIACGRCLNNCCTEALRLVGEHKSDSEIKKILMRDENFYQETGGGVTFSGGEVTSQPQYASRLTSP